LHRRSLKGRPPTVKGPTATIKRPETFCYRSTSDLPAGQFTSASFEDSAAAGFFSIVPGLAAIAPVAPPNLRKLLAYRGNSSRMQPAGC
jgi:hypothetical protein